MKTNSDKLYERFKRYDFGDAKPVAHTPHLAKLQAHAGKKARITIRVDAEVLAAFKARAEKTGGNYQTLMNEALRESAQGMHLADVVRDVAREVLEQRPASKTKDRLKKVRAV